MALKQQSKEVFVTLAVGQKYLNNFNKKFRKSFEYYAEKNNFELVVIEQSIKKSDKHIPWEKLLIFNNPIVSSYKRAMFLDADVYITKHAKNPFDIVNEKLWGSVDNNPYNLSSLTKTDPELYKFCPKENRPNRLLNTGMFIVSDKLKPTLEMIYKEYPEQKKLGKWTTFLSFIKR